MKNFFFIHKYKVFSETENKKSIMTIILVICQARDTKSLKKYFFSGVLLLHERIY